MPSQNSSPTLSVSLNGVALSAVILAIASLATLTIIVTVKNVDLLSTVALVLAILAFVVQIIVFIFQSADVTRQTQQSRELHAEMLGLVSQLEERAKGTQQTVDRMNTRLLEAVIGKARNEGISPDSPDFAERVAIGLVSAPPTPSEPSRDRANAAAARRRSRAASVALLGEAEYPPPLPREHALDIHLEMDRPLDQNEVAIAEDLLKGLKWHQLSAIRNFANDLRTSSRAGSAFGPGLKTSFADELIQRGILVNIPGWPLQTLTENGRVAGRLFSAGFVDGVEAPHLQKMVRDLEDKDKEMEARAHE
jgi:hypothetical protein